MSLANVQAPRGFALARNVGKMSPPRTERPVAAGRTLDLMVCDAYSLDAGGNAVVAEGTEGTPGVVKGIVELIVLRAIPRSPEGPVSQDYIAADEDGNIVGIEDHNAIFLVQTSGAYVNPTDNGKLVDLVNSAPNTTLAQSRQAIDSATLGSGTQFITVAPDDTVEQTITGAQNFVNVLVQIAN